MMGVFATGRKAQNYYHYLSMTNSCYFDMLTTNTQVFRLPLLFLCHHPHQRDPHCILIDDTMKIPFQRKLMQQKTLICYSLNVALWFFGHNATTAVGQVFLLLDNIIMISSPAGGLDWDGHGDEGLPHPQPPRPAGQANTKLLRRDLRCPLGY